jgi:ABC-type branched-subunit amino acid transport system ATPase component
MYVVEHGQVAAVIQQHELEEKREFLQEFLGV